jgi:hypothetical protein
VSVPDAIGSAGVTLLLVAFLLNLTGRLDRDARAYQGLNLVGAGCACWASWMIGFIPFVVLEGVWAVVAAVALARGATQKGVTT